jgi:NADH:ubiquinone reductase (H+-translocating)
VPLPGVAPVAIQQGAFLAKLIAKRVSRDGAGARETFRYFDKGSLATIGRSCAVAAIGGLRMSGFFAWLTWLFVHILYLVGFRNRVSVVAQWAWSYATFQRGARLITKGHAR